MTLRSSRSWIIALAVVGLGLAAQPARAGYETATYAFTESNVLSDLTFPSNYGTVKLESFDGLGTGGGGLSAGQIRITVDVNTSYYTSIGSNFGIDKFAFNFANLNLTTPGNIATVPSGWDFTINPNGSFGGFANFDAETAGQGNDRRDPLVILISNQNTAALIENVAFLSEAVGNNVKKQNEAQQLAFFAAHVAGFGETDGQTSQYIGVTNPNSLILQSAPAPAGLILLVSVAPLLAIRRIFRRKPVAA